MAAFTRLNVLEKFSQSRQTFVELGNHLRCQACHGLACNPHITVCEHTFCLGCLQDLEDEQCLVCGRACPLASCQPDGIVANLIEAYIPMAHFLHVMIDKPSEGAQNVLAGKSAAPADRKPPAESNPLCDATKPSPRLIDETVTPTHRPRERQNSCGSLESTFSTATPSNFKIHKRNQKGETALQVACVKGDVSLVRELLAQGADPNTQDYARWTPLHEAVAKGNEALVEILLNGGANPNIPGGKAENATPLHDAVSYGNRRIVRLLVTRGADLHARNNRGQTPRDLCQPRDDDMLYALEHSAAAPSSINLAEKVKQPMMFIQAVHLLLLGIDKKSMPKYTKLAKSLGFKLAHKHSAQVTHVVVRQDDANIKTNANFYSAVLQGQWIIDFGWVDEIEATGRWIDPSPYELDGRLRRVYPSGAASRLNGSMQLPGLFNNCSFYLHNAASLSSPTKEDVTTWIKCGGGNVLSRAPNPETIPPNERVPYHAKPDGPMAKCAHYILYDSAARNQPTMKYNMAHVKTLSIGWFVACIEDFALLDPF